MEELIINIDYVARLAKLQLSQEEREKLRNDLERIVKMFEELKSINTEEVEILVFPHEGYFQKLREDAPREGLKRIDVIKLAPKEMMMMFMVPSPFKTEEKEKK